ncbi:unnamed protein product, partial [Medioppia subpectinata]
MSAPPVASNQQNIHILHTLLYDLKKIMKKYYCWGHGSKRLTDLPEELIREILLRLTDYKDLMNSGEAYNIMQSLLDEQHIWRQLCKYHYSRAQLRWLFANTTNTCTPDGKVDWEQVFHQLR